MKGLLKAFDLQLKATVFTELYQISILLYYTHKITLILDMLPACVPCC